MEYGKLVGKSKEEIDEYLLNVHSRVFGFYRKQNIQWNDLPSIQTSIMSAGGYSVKEVINYGDSVEVIFNGNDLFPNNPLKGEGKNELEAICNACSNFVENPFEYNSFSKKYFKEDKTE